MAINEKVDTKAMGQVLSRAADGLRTNTDTHVRNYIRNTQSSNEIAGQALMEVVKTGNKDDVKKFAKVANVSGDAIPALEERAEVINVANQLALNQDPAARQDIDEGFTSGATPMPDTPYSVLAEEAHLQEEANRGIISFENPWQEFWLPMMLGAKPGNILLAKLQRREQARQALFINEKSADWYQSYDRRIDSGMGHSDAIRETSREYGFVAPGANSLSDPSSSERDANFIKTFMRRMQDPEYQKQFSAIGDIQERVKAMTLHTFIDILQETGNLPEELWPNFKAMTGFREPAMSTEVAQYLETHGINPQAATPSQIATATDEVRLQGLTDTRLGEFARAIGQEDAEIASFEGRIARQNKEYSSTAQHKAYIDEQIAQALHEAGVDRKIDETIAVTLARENAEMEAKMDQPVGPQIAERMGLTPGTTFREMYAMKAVPLGDNSQSSYIQSALNLIDVMQPIAEKLFTEKGFNRFTQGGKLQWQKWKQSNPDLAAWTALRMSLAFSLAKASGERGVLSRQDVKPYLEAIPSTFHSKVFADGFFNTYKTMLTANKELFERRTRPFDGAGEGVPKRKDGESIADWMKRTGGGLR